MIGTCAWCHDKLPLIDWQIVCPECGRDSMVTIVRAGDPVWRDPAWLGTALIQRGLTTRQAAEVGGTSAQTISRWARKHGVKR